MNSLRVFVIGGLMAGLALSERDAGLVISVEFLTLALAAILIAPARSGNRFINIILIITAVTFLRGGRRCIHCITVLTV